MKEKEYYSIGEVSRICNISQKALRYYEDIGLIISKRSKGNNYRCYTPDDILAVPVIKYYKQMGFRLEEMRELINGDLYRIIKRHFKLKLAELEGERDAITRKFISVKDWYNLILEAEMVIDNDMAEPAVKYVDESSYLFQRQSFECKVKSSIINIKFTNFVESVRNEITGPVLIHFSSIKNRLQEKPQQIEIMQKTLLDCKPEYEVSFGGSAMLSCYHIGSHGNIEETYRKMIEWAKHNGYVLQEDAYERYVTDYWTTNHSEKYVTEILINTKRKHGKHDSSGIKCKKSEK